MNHNDSVMTLHSTMYCSAYSTLSKSDCVEQMVVLCYNERVGTNFHVNNDL